MCKCVTFSDGVQASACGPSQLGLDMTLHLHHFKYIPQLINGVVDLRLLASRTALGCLPLQVWVQQQ